MNFIKRTLKITSVVALIVATAMSNSFAAGKAKKSKDNYQFKLGVASYSLRKFPVDEALNMTKRLGVDNIALKSYHFPMDATAEVAAQVKSKSKAAGINFYGTGVIYMKSKEEVDKAFENAKLAGVKMIIGVPNHELLPYVEKKVKAYDIKLAIHNHGPGDKLYPSAESAYNLIKDMDKRMGLCIDIGHTKRIGRNPEQDLVDFFDRVFDIHIKDVTKAEKDGRTCEIGRGVIDFPAFLKAVKKSGYTGVLALEFEKDSNDPLAGMAESVGYIKGVIESIK
ncbi:sugar phosphate isomerase/epimerase [Puteibacter caeruleilacunae]|nr:sugar phosphate isomerase/epimerase [Puteibacter caeruleilacunae]